MSKDYYSDLATYPSIFFPILERIQYFICKELLYSGEDYVTPHSKFIRGELTDNGFRISAKKQKSTNLTFPFTVWAFDDFEIDEERLNSNAKIGAMYSSTYDSLMDSTSCIINIPMMSIFTSAYDYVRAWQILTEANITKTKLDVPIVVNSVNTVTKIMTDMEIVRGPYAFELEQQLRVGRLDAIQHNLKIYFSNLLLNTSVSPVDDIEVALDSYVNEDYRDSIVVGSGLVPDTPYVVSTTPTHNEVDVAVDQSIQIDFNVAMKEEETVDNLYFTPFFLYETVWSSNSKSVIVDPHDNLGSGITYSGIVYAEAQSGDEVEMEEDYRWAFITEV